MDINSTNNLHFGELKTFAQMNVYNAQNITGQNPSINASRQLVNIQNTEQENNKAASPAPSLTPQPSSDTIIIAGKEIKKKTAIAALIGSLTTLTASIIFVSSMVKKGNIMLENNKEAGLFKKFREGLRTFTKKGKEDYEKAVNKNKPSNTLNQEQGINEPQKQEPIIDEPIKKESGTNEALKQEPINQEQVKEKQPEGKPEDIEKILDDTSDNPIIKTTEDKVSIDDTALLKEDTKHSSDEPIISTPKEEQKQEQKPITKLPNNSETSSSLKDVPIKDKPIKQEPQKQESIKEDTKEALSGDCASNSTLTAEETDGPLNKSDSLPKTQSQTGADIKNDGTDVQSDDFSKGIQNPAQDGKVQPETKTEPEAQRTPVKNPYADEAKKLIDEIKAGFNIQKSNSNNFILNLPKQNQESAIHAVNQLDIPPTNAYLLHLAQRAAKNSNRTHYPERFLKYKEAVAKSNTDAKFKKAFEPFAYELSNATYNMPENLTTLIETLSKEFTPEELKNIAKFHTGLSEFGCVAEFYSGSDASYTQKAIDESIKYLHALGTGKDTTVTTADETLSTKTWLQNLLNANPENIGKTDLLPLRNLAKINTLIAEILKKTGSKESPETFAELVCYIESGSSKALQKAFDEFSPDGIKRIIQSEEGLEQLYNYIKTPEKTYTYDKKFLNLLANPKTTTRQASSAGASLLKEVKKAADAFSSEQTRLVNNIQAIYNETIEKYSGENIDSDTAKLLNMFSQQCKTIVNNVNEKTASAQDAAKSLEDALMSKTAKAGEKSLLKGIVEQRRQETKNTIIQELKDKVDILDCNKASYLQECSSNAAPIDEMLSKVEKLLFDEFGIKTIRLNPGENFDNKYMIIANTVKTGNQTLDGKVAGTLHPGFQTKEGEILRPIEVRTYSYDETLAGTVQTSQTAGSELSEKAAPTDKITEHTDSLPNNELFLSLLNTNKEAYNALEGKYFDHISTLPKAALKNFPTNIKHLKDFTGEELSAIVNTKDVNGMEALDDLLSQKEGSLSIEHIISQLKGIAEAEISKNSGNSTKSRIFAGATGVIDNTVPETTFSESTEKYMQETNLLITAQTELREALHKAAEQNQEVIETLQPSFNKIDTITEKLLGQNSKRVLSANPTTSNAQNTSNTSETLQNTAILGSATSPNETAEGVKKQGFFKKIFRRKK